MRNVTFMPFVIVRCRPEDYDEDVNYLYFFTQEADGTGIYGVELNGSKPGSTGTYQAPVALGFAYQFGEDLMKGFGTEVEINDAQILKVETADLTPNSLPAIYRRTLPGQSLSWLPSNYEQVLKSVPNPCASMVVENGLPNNQYNVVVVGTRSDGRVITFVLTANETNYIGVTVASEKPYIISEAAASSAWTGAFNEELKRIVEATTGYEVITATMVAIEDYETINGSVAPDRH